MISMTILLSIPLILAPLIGSINRFFKFYRNPTTKEPFEEDEEILDNFEMPREVTSIVKRKNEYPEILFMGISPLVGVALIFIFQKDIHPFAIEHTPTLGVFVVIAYAAYWISRKGKALISTNFSLLLPIGMMIGILLYIALLLHFISPMVLLGGAMLPFFAFPLFAPLPAILYNIRELHDHRQFILENRTKQEGLLYDAFQTAPWYQNTIYFSLMIGCIMVLLVGLLAFGQDMDSIIQVFTGGEEFLFSNKRNSIF